VKLTSSTWVMSALGSIAIPPPQRRFQPIEMLAYGTGAGICCLQAVLLAECPVWVVVSIPHGRTKMTSNVNGDCRV
jgi:hypothetical protein